MGTHRTRVITVVGPKHQADLIVAADVRIEDLLAPILTELKVPLTKPGKAKKKDVPKDSQAWFGAKPKAPKRWRLYAADATTVLPSGATLGELGIPDGAVLHCQQVAKPSGEPAPAPSALDAFVPPDAPDDVSPAADLLPESAS